MRQRTHPCAWYRCARNAGALPQGPSVRAGKSARRKSRPCEGDQSSAKPYRLDDCRSLWSHNCRGVCREGQCLLFATRSEEHTSALQSLMRNSYAVVCLKKKKRKNTV